MTPFNFSDKKDTNVVISKESFKELKLMDLALGRHIESMKSTMDTLNTFHYTVGRLVAKIKETDPNIDGDSDLT